MKTLQQWIKRRKQKPIEDSFYIQGYNDACDHLITLLPSLTATLEAEILEMVGKDVEVPLDVTNTDLVHRIANIGLMGESNGKNQEKSRMRTAITTYFKRDI